MDRRDFLKTTSAASLLACFPASLAGIERTSEPGKLERRSLGRTGEKLSIIGFGGIVVKNATTAGGVQPGRRGDRPRRQLLRRRAQLRQRRGHARSGPRAATARTSSSRARPRSAAPRGRERSSRARCARCGRDHFDLYQLHAVTTPDDVEKIFAPGRRAGDLPRGTQGGQGPLPRLLRTLRRGGHRPDRRATTSTRSSSRSTSPPGTPGASARRCWRRRRRRRWASWR